MIPHPSLMVVPALVYLTLVAVSGPSMVALAFNGEYLNTLGCLYLLILYYLISLLVRLMIITLTLLEAPREILRGSALKLVAQLTLGLGAILLWDIYGAVLMVITGEVAAAVYYAVTLKLAGVGSKWPQKAAPGTATVRTGS